MSVRGLLGSEDLRRSHEARVRRSRRSGETSGRGRFVRNRSFRAASMSSSPRGARRLAAMAPSYHRLGEVPAKRHVAFRAPDGALYDEEVVGLEGFSGRYSILYHRYAPTRVA